LPPATVPLDFVASVKDRATVNDFVERVEPLIEN